MKRFLIALTTLFAVAGCAPADTGEDSPEDADEQEFRDGASFSARIVVPELTWSWFEPSEDAPAFLALEITGSAGGVLGVGADKHATTDPLIMVGADAYGYGGSSLRIGKDMLLYKQAAATEHSELYCCLGTPDPKKVDGVWRGPWARIADVGEKGHYVVGKLVGVRPEDLRHGAKLRIDQIQLSGGAKLGFTRRIMRGDRLVTIEASSVPPMAAAAPDLAADPEAMSRAARARDDGAGR
jgi:hypothetical protein